jgi:hypothetical protein
MAQSPTVCPRRFCRYVILARLGWVSAEYSPRFINSSPSRARAKKAMTQHAQTAASSGSSRLRCARIRRSMSIVYGSRFSREDSGGAKYSHPSIVRWSTLSETRQGTSWISCHALHAATYPWMVFLEYDAAIAHTHAHITCVEAGRRAASSRVRRSAHMLKIRMADP